MGKIKDYIIIQQETVELPEFTKDCSKDLEAAEDRKNDLEYWQAVQADMIDNEAGGN